MRELPSVPTENALPSSDPLSDWELIRRTGVADVAAFERLYRRYYDYLYRFIFQITRRPEFIEDVINEVMLVVWKKAARVQPQAKASTWIMGIAYKISLKFTRRSGTSVPAADLAATNIGVPDGADSIAMIDSENVLLAALKLLSEEQRATLELLFYHGMNYRDIAVLLGCTEGTVKTRIYYAREKLRTFREQLMGVKLLVRDHG